MATPDNLVLIYKELADWHERQGQPQMRDRFLVLAADAALSAGRPVEGDLLLARLLRSNPHHMLRPFASFGEAMASPDIQNYVGELRRTYPPEQAEQQFDKMRQARGAAAGRQTRALPPTAPVVDLDNEAEAAGAGREPLKVYRVQNEADGTSPPSRAARPGLPAAARPYPLPAEPLPRSIPLGAESDDVATGSWVSVGLSVLVLAAGLALAGWTLLEPFLRSR